MVNLPYGDWPYESYVDVNGYFAGFGYFDDDNLNIEESEETSSQKLRWVKLKILKNEEVI